MKTLFPSRVLAAFCLVILSFAAGLNAAVVTETDSVPAGGDRPTYCEPVYSDGDGQMYRYLARSIRYPAEAASKNVQGRVVVCFNVGVDGKVANARVLRRVSPVLDAEALRVVQGLGKFSPATVDGKPVESTLLLPVRFTLANSTDLDTGEVRLSENVDAIMLDEVVVIGAAPQ